MRFDDDEVQMIKSKSLGTSVMHSSRASITRYVFRRSGSSITLVNISDTAIQVFISSKRNRPA